MLKLSGHSATQQPSEQHCASSFSSFAFFTAFCISLLLPPLTSSRININPDVNINVPSRHLSADQSGVPTASQRGATLLQVTVGSHYGHIKALFPCRHTLARSHACIKWQAIIRCQGAQEVSGDMLLLLHRKNQTIHTPQYCSRENRKKIKLK